MNKGFTLKVLFLLYFLFPQTAREQSFTPGKIWPDNHQAHVSAHDEGVLYDNGIYYRFDEHKTEGEAGNIANVGVHCYSSDNLYHWNDCGIALSVAENNPKHIISKGCILERPKIIYNLHTKKYAMWLHLELKGAEYSGALGGVVVSDRMTSPYTFLRTARPDTDSWPVNVPPVRKTARRPSIEEEHQRTGNSLPVYPDSLSILGRDMERGQMAHDTNLFTDDSGKAYHTYSSEENSTLHITELDSSYAGYIEKYTRILTNRFMEAPVMFKKDGDHYLTMPGCTGWSPNAAQSVIASFIRGGWKESGDPCVGQGADLTFYSQNTYILPVRGKRDQFICMDDRWTPQNVIGGCCTWLPIHFEGERPVIE